MRKRIINTIFTLFISIFIALGISGVSLVHADDTFTVTFHSGDGGEFEDGSTTNVVEYESVSCVATKYSHTSNVDDTGLQTGNYGNSWKNANITGTDRGDTSKAHVVSIPGASNLKVELYFNGENISYDWVSVWYGAHPDYTAASNYSTSAGKPTTDMGAPNTTNKYGGSSLNGVTFGTYEVNGNTLTNMGHVTLTLPGDSVTFSFKSDSSGCGKGYGYYAIITGTDTNGDPYISTRIDAVSGEYKEPVGYEVGYTPHRLAAWYDNPQLTGDPVDLDSLTTNIDLYAAYEENLIASGTFGCPWRILGDGSLEIGRKGQSCTLANETQMGTNGWPWYSYRSQITSTKINGDVHAAAGSLTGMFDSQPNNQSIDLKGFDTSNATNFSHMFNGCSSLASLDLGDKFDTSNGTDFECMFQACDLTSLDLGDKFDTSNGTNFDSMFSNCTKLASLDLGDKFDTSKSTKFGGMFSGCSSLASLDLGDKFDTSNGTNFDSMFSSCKALTSLDLGDKFDTSKGIAFTDMFYNCSSLTSLDLGDKFDTSKGTSFKEMFMNCSALTSLNLGDKFNTSNATSFNNTFYNCSSLTSLDLGDNFDTSKGTNFNGMFSNCRALTSLDLGDKFDTSKCTNAGFMFSDCNALTSLNLGDKFDTSKNTNFSHMFNGCSSLASLDLGDKFDTSKCTDFRAMFSTCPSLTSLDLGDKFDTSKGTDFSTMFNGCSSVTTLDLGNKFDTSNATNLQNMFSSMSSLKAIIIPSVFDFDGKNITGSKRAVLPTPKSPSTKWMRIYDLNTMQPLKGDDRTQLTAAQLRDTWDGSTMAGLWIWDQLDPTSMGYGDATTQYSEDPKWNVLSEDTWEYTFDVFDDTLQYYLKEEPIPGFISDIDPNTGYIEIHDKVGEITNRTTTELGSLTVRKTVAGIETTDKFDFTITLSGRGIPAEGTKIIDGVVFTNGVGHIQLGHGESKTFNNIPEGVTYTVTEDNVSDRYTVTSTGESGSIIREGKTASFTNTYTYDEETTNPVDVRLRKVTSGDADIDADTEYEFLATFAGLERLQEYQIMVNNPTSGGTPNIQTSSFTADANGSAYTTVRLKKNGTAVFSSIPSGATYRFKETEGDWLASYEITNQTSAGTIRKDKDANNAKNTALETGNELAEPNEETTVTFTNTYVDKGGLKVRKTVAGDPEDKTKFEFHITFTDMKEGDSFRSSIGLFTADEDGIAEKDFYLAAGEEVTFEDMPVGIKYQITEGKSLYKASYTITDEGDAYATPRIVKASDENAEANKDLSTAIETLDKGEKATVLFTNSKDTGSLKVRKTGTEAVDSTTNFTFDITLMGPRFGISGDFEYTGSKTGTITFDKNGHGQITLKKGQEIVITNIPVGTEYKVEEVDPDNEYVKTYTDNTGTISTTMATAVTNNDIIRNSDISIKKTVAGTMGNKFSKFNFTINLRKGGTPVTGTFTVEGGDTNSITFNSSGNATFTLSHNQTITIKDVPIDATYTVTEQSYAADGYTTTSTHPTGTIVEDAASNNVTFMNTRNVSIPTSAHTSLGFIMMIALAIGGLGIVLSKKKKGATH